MTAAIDQVRPSNEEHSGGKAPLLLSDQEIKAAALNKVDGVLQSHFFLWVLMAFLAWMVKA